VDPIVLGVFAFVYFGMFLGRIPGLALDRTGVALLGAIVLLATKRLTEQEAEAAVDLPTLALLLGLMVVSAQLRLGGFYTHVTRQVGEARLGPEALLALLVLVAGILSAMLVNDVVCFAMAPVLVETCVHRRLNPRPFLLALACAANVGSAATLIGNPQNVLIGQLLGLSFRGYLAIAAVPTLLGLGVVWWVVKRAYRGRWEEGVLAHADVEAPAYDRYQTGKGLLVLLALVVAFLFTDLPRDLLPLAAAGLLLASRKLATRRMLGLVDWPLLVLFVGLFLVNNALAKTGALFTVAAGLRAVGIDTARPVLLFPVTVVLSNLVSNVPAVMLLLPTARTTPLVGPVLALASTFAGNLLMVGSVANMIVADRAAQLGVSLPWKEHARVGVPITVATLSIAAVWLWVVARWTSG
jgi:Na+/H+ antiporter NhaD/arsenite permease-like protein